MNRSDTGLLLDEKNIKLQRFYFKEAVRLKGINVIYREPLPNMREYNGYGELDEYFKNPIVVGCLFEEQPNQWTMKKLGWNSELQEDDSIIQVEYDLPGLKEGALFILPSSIDNAEGRVFRVVKMRTSPVYPATITCELAPVFKSSYEESQTDDYTQSDFNLLR